MAIRRALSAPSTVPPVPQIATSSLKSFFSFLPHPYVVRDGHAALDDRALDCFWVLCFRRFGREPVPAYRISESFDIHRAVLAGWIAALERRQAVIQRTKQGLVFSPTDTKPPLVNFSLARAYDPWVDRDYDRFMFNRYAAFPWEVIDKYYLIECDEVLFYTGERRIRPDGRPFTPATYEQIQEYFPHRSDGWKRGDWSVDRYDALCEAVTGENNRPRRGGIARRISAKAIEAATREEQLQAELKAAAEARIDRVGVRGHVWLEDFCRRAPPSTPDEWFLRALAEERERASADKRWRNIVKKLGYDPLSRTNAQKPGVGQTKPRQSAGGAKLFRRPPIPKNSAVRYRG